MMSALVLACVSMLPALAVADVFRLGWCSSSYDRYLDQKTFTQEGINMMGEFATAGPAKMYIWDPSTAEKDFKDMSFELDLTAKTFKLKYTGANGPEMVEGAAGFNRSSTKTMFKLDTAPKASLANIFSFDSKGVADLYPVHISATDLILAGCNTVLLGKRETMYVLTNQDYSAVDSACAIQAIKDKTTFTTVVA